MHQNYARSPPRAASPASSPRTNPTRTNNPRDQAPPARVRSTGDGNDEWSREDDSAVADREQSPNNAEDSKKLNQVLQNYFYKAFLVIAHSRVNLPQAYSRGLNAAKRVNRWFNIILDETDEFREDIRPWKNGNHVERPPAPLVVEVYLDTAELASNQVLVAVDDAQKKWNVADALNSSASSGHNSLHGEPRREIILERWEISFDTSTPVGAFKDMGAILPAVYKRSIVLFRSLFYYARFLPAWKYSRRFTKLTGQSNNALKVKCRVVSGKQSDTEVDSLTLPLIPGISKVTDDFVFGSTETPAGSFTIRLSYRTQCDFRIEDSESILSSQFLGMDEPFFRPSLGSERLPSYMMSTKEIGSLPVERRNFGNAPPDRSQAYGSLSTFHQVGPTTGTSPLTALREARNMMDESPSSPRQPLQPSGDSRIQDSREPSLGQADGRPAAPRRPSVSFKPFKSGSMSGSSPIQSDQMMPPPAKPNQTGAFNPANHIRSRPSSGSIPQSALRSSVIASETAIASSASGSPRPAPITRYTSSFSNRKPRHSSGNASKTEDENSSGKVSLTSSAQRGSGLLNEGPGASSDSIPTDADIEVFINMLDMKKNLKSFENPTNASRSEASTKRTSAALSKFQKMRESNNALSDSISSSLLLQRSSTSSSRQLSSVPPMLVGASISTSSSPGKPVSPHTPHTPAIPSRLSAGQSAEYAINIPRRSRTSFSRRRSARSRSPPTLATIRSEVPQPSSPDTSTTAIDIPTSPRIYQTHLRRSSSVVADHRAPLPFSAADNIDPDASAPYAYALRSASTGPQDRDPPSMSALLAMTDLDPLRAPNQRSTSPNLSISGPHPPSQLADDEHEEGEEDDEYEGPFAPVHHHQRLARASASSSYHRGRGNSASSSTRGIAPTSTATTRLSSEALRPQTRTSSFSSLEQPGPSLTGAPTSTRPYAGSWRPTSSFRGAMQHSSSAGSSGVHSGAGAAGSSAAAAAQQQIEDEPLVFAMSELGGVRRSLEEMRGGFAAGGGESAGSSRRGSRRGGGGRGGEAREQTW